MLRDDLAPRLATRPSVLIIDDDPAAAGALSATMERAGFAVRCAADGAAGLRAAELQPPDLVLLEPGLPDLDGLEVLRRLRRSRSAASGVIIVSRRTAEHHRLAGFAAGADDYVTKPFSAGEISVRAAGILRRLGAHRAPARSPRLSGGPLDIDPLAQRVTLRGRSVALTRLEYGLLFDLASQPQKVRTREQLIHAVWGHELRAEPSTVTVHIQRLRRKLHAAGGPPELIETVRGLGYRFSPAL